MFIADAQDDRAHAGCLSQGVRDKLNLVSALRRTGFVLLAIGWIGCVGGIGWAVLFVGVPYPDPTPAQRVDEAFHVQVSNQCLLVGFAALVAACAVLLLWAIVAVLQRRKSRRS